MQALRWHSATDLRLDDVDAPGAPVPGHAVVQVAYCGICGTDLHEFAHGPVLIRTTPHPLTGEAPPLALGHELSGTVLALGSPVPGISVGDRVVADPCWRCGQCHWCRRGEYHLCALGGSVGLASAGAFAEQVTVPAEGLSRLPDSVPDDVAALAEPLAVGLHAIRRAAVQPGDHVLLLGAGPIGVAALLAARLAGAAGLYVSEPAPGRRERAARLGATEVFDPGTDDVRREVFLRTGRVGPDVVVEATGVGALAAEAIRAARRGGRVVLAGVGGDELTVPTAQLVFYERTVLGSLGYNHDIPRVIDLLAAGRLSADELISGCHPLTEGVDVFAELAAGRSDQLKVLLRPGRT